MRILNEGELKSATWVKVRDYVNDRISILQKELESDLAPIRTAKARGKIEELRKLLSVEKPDPEVRETKPHY